MESTKQNVPVNGIKRAFFGGRGIQVASGVAAAILATATARGAVILPITAADVPISNSASAFDASNSGNTYSLEPGTTFIPAGFDTRDLFGGSFGTFGPEQNDVIFDNNQPIGTVESVDVTLSSPISLNNFNLFLEDDGITGDRSASEFMLYSNGQLIDDVPILDTTGSQSYTGQYGSNYIQISDTLVGLPASSNYTLDFVQNRNGNGTSGIRALDFEATGGAGKVAVTSVPEPMSMAGLMVGGISLAFRRRVSPAH